MTYTPDIRDVMHAAHYRYSPGQCEESLAAHDAEVRAQALREAADVLDRQPAKAKHGLPMMLRADWLRARANRIEQGGQP